MAKKINPGEIDPKAIIAAFREDGPVSRFIPQKEIEPEETAEQPEEKTPVAPSREENRKRRGKENYETLFIGKTQTFFFLQNY
ncbi:hypothetical protein FACS1894160_4580 [Bacteroidia bacterium]|nr:hypothetical protein FACS1894160_4580 [Bacteroidia bacterium]